eukprot:11215575-Lingulodinium_polyedra.AAC.1
MAPPWSYLGRNDLAGGSGRSGGHGWAGGIPAWRARARSCRGRHRAGPGRLRRAQQGPPARHSVHSAVRPRPR